MEPDGLHRHTPTLSGDIVIRCISLDSALSQHVGDALTNLTQQAEWLELADTVEEVIAAASVTVEDYYSPMLVGSVFTFIVNPPGGWLLLDGSTYANADYPELSAVLPSHLISGANFTLPDVSAAFSYGVQDDGDGSAIEGDNVLNLVVGQIPAHTHDYIPPVPAATVGGAGPPLPSTQAGGAIPTTSVGSGDDIDRRPLRFGLIFAVFAGRV